jgi:dCMP deaminase
MNFNPSHPNRPCWGAYAINLAKTAASRSEDSYRQVGACALNKEHMVLAVGYNGLASGTDAPPNFWDDRDVRRKFMIHAETNCLSLCKKGEVDLLAITHLPCSSCATMISAYGIPKVVYCDEYERDTIAKEIFNFYNIELIKISP